MKKIILLLCFSFLCTLHFYKIEKINTNENTINYIQIEKINLMQEIKSYQESTVDKNIIFLKESNFDAHFYILAAHSGNSKIAFFKKLYTLQKEDKILLSINNEMQEFFVDSISYVEKTGKIILPFPTQDTLYLTTCDRFHKDRQLVIKCVKKV